MTVEEAGTQECSRCFRLSQRTVYVYAFDREGNIIKNDFYGKIFCLVCWKSKEWRDDDNERLSIRKYRVEHPYNDYVRWEYDGVPCVSCGTYIDSGFIRCPGDNKCVRLAKKLDICLGSKHPEYSNSSDYGNGIHDYKKYDYFGWEIFECKCGKKLKIKKDKETKIIEKYTKYRSRYSSYRTALGELRHLVFKRDNYKCLECGATKEETTLEIDHIIPWSKGGQTHIDNLQVLCKKCNRSKHARIWDDLGVPPKDEGQKEL